MKGMAIPGLKDLEKAYDHFVKGGLDEAHMADYSQWSRFDPRLAEIWITYLRKHWQTMNPMKLRTALLEKPWPAAGAVLSEFVKGNCENEFKWWAKLLSHNIPKADWEQFFIGIRKLGTETMIDDAKMSLEPYKKWGYLSRENVGRKQSKNKARVFSKLTRKELLRNLLKLSPRITVEEYWNETEKSISKRQAERDLKMSALVKGVGKTKGRYYEKK